MQHFINLADHSAADIQHLLAVATELKSAWHSEGNAPYLRGQTLAMLFMKPSLRTRVSFAVAMQHLGGAALYLGPEEVGLGAREAIPDVARVLGGYVQGIMARVFAHEHITQLARHSPVPVINGLSDYNHPCQALADILTIQEAFGTLEGVRVAYVGDGNNVARSLLFITNLLGMPFAVASPPGYQLDAADLQTAAQLRPDGAPAPQLGDDPAEAVRDAAVIYTDTWTSMGQEAEAEARRAVFANYQVNAGLLAQADKDAVVLHCLPAHRGEEITDEVADGPQSRIFQQAANRLHAQKAVLWQLLGQH
ncbi:MAG: ornithine carbamoyltransferase [Anaerolineales bacterium]